MIKAEREGADIGTFGEYVFPENRVAACMIMGDGYNAKIVRQTLTSLKLAGVDKLFLAYNGKSRSTITWMFRHLKKIDLPFVVQKFKWEDNFAKARQQSFDLVPKDEFDWMMWIDADDRFMADKPLDEMFDSLDPYTLGVYIRYDYSVEPETGAVTVQQWRERFFSTKVDWQWKYPVHEVCIGPPGMQFAKRDHCYVVHLRTPEQDYGTRNRNRRIIAKALKEDPTDQRMQFYFANEAAAEADSIEEGSEKWRVAAAAILAYKRFASNPNVGKEDLYLAATRIGDLHLMRHDTNKAIDAFLESLKINPEWPDAYIGLARACLELEDWGKCLSFANLAVERPKPVTSSAITPVTYDYSPLLLRGIALEGLGRFEEAQIDFKAAAEIWNPSGGLLEWKLKEIERKIAVQPLDKDERKRLRGSRPDKSIAFVTAPLPEPWHPILEAEGGAGGAETCIMRLAPRFVADGWRVSVFGTPGFEHKGVNSDGVEYWDSEEYIPNEKFKIVVSSEIPPESVITAKLF